MSLQSQDHGVSIFRHRATNRPTASLAAEVKAATPKPSPGQAVKAAAASLHPSLNHRPLPAPTGSSQTSYGPGGSMTSPGAPASPSSGATGSQTSYGAGGSMTNQSSAEASPNVTGNTQTSFGPNGSRTSG